MIFLYNRKSPYSSRCGLYGDDVMKPAMALKRDNFLQEREFSKEVGAVEIGRGDADSVPRKEVRMGRFITAFVEIGPHGSA